MKLFFLLVTLLSGNCFADNWMNCQNNNPLKTPYNIKSLRIDVSEQRPYSVLLMHKFELSQEQEIIEQEVEVSLPWFQTYVSRHKYSPKQILVDSVGNTLDIHTYGAMGKIYYRGVINLFKCTFSNPFSS